jgi:hypothetical protein
VLTEQYLVVGSALGECSGQFNGRAGCQPLPRNTRTSKYRPGLYSDRERYSDVRITFRRIVRFGDDVAYFDGRSHCSDSVVLMQLQQSEYPDDHIADIALNGPTVAPNDVLTYHGMSLNYLIHRLRIDSRSPHMHRDRNDSHQPTRRLDSLLIN